MERRRCGQVGPRPCYSKSEVIYVYLILKMLLLGFFWQKYHFWHFLITMEPFSIFFLFLAHVLIQVKTYHYAKVQRNACLDFARMMVQTYRQTDTQTPSFIYIEEVEDEKFHFGHHRIAYLVIGG